MAPGRIWQALLADLDEAGRIDWQHCSIDRLVCWGEKGGRSDRPQPRRPDEQAPRHVDGHGIPLALHLSNNCCHDITQAVATLETDPRPETARRAGAPGQPGWPPTRAMAAAPSVAISGSEVFAIPFRNAMTRAGGAEAGRRLTIPSSAATVGSSNACSLSSTVFAESSCATKPLPPPISVSCRLLPSSSPVRVAESPRPRIARLWSDIVVEHLLHIVQQLHLAVPQVTRIRSSECEGRTRMEDLSMNWVSR